MKNNSIKKINEKSPRKHIDKKTSKEKKSLFEKISGLFKDNNDFINIIILVLFSFVGTYFYLPWNGVVSAIPIVIVCAFICTFVELPEILKAAVFFASPFATTLLLGERVPTSLYFAFSCFAFYVLAKFVVVLVRKEKFLLKTASVLLLILSLSIHVFENSTPWDVSKNSEALSNYIFSNYKDEKVVVSNIKFDAFDRTYSVSLIPKTNMGLSMDVLFKDGKVVEDEYVDYCEKYIMLVGAGKITKTIKEVNNELRFKVSSDGIYGYPFSIPATVEPKADYSKYMDFSVHFTSYNDSKKFAAMAEECFRALLKSDFCCRTITFYGGIGGGSVDGRGAKYVAKISVPFNSAVGNLSNFVTPCDEEIFKYTALK